MPNHRTYITEGSSVGSIDSRPSELADSIGSVSKVARAKNCRSAACRKLSYSAPTASAGGRFRFGTAGIIDHACAVRRCSTFFDDFARPRRVPRLRQRLPSPGATRTPRSARAACAFAARLDAAGLRKGDTVALLVREPPRVDRRALGLSASGRHRRSHRLPRVGRLPPARRRDRQVAGGADRRGSRGVLARRLGRRGVAARRARLERHGQPSRARRSPATTSPRSSSRRAPPPNRRASSSRTATCWPTSCPSSARS